MTAIYKMTNYVAQPLLKSTYQKGLLTAVTGLGAIGSYASPYIANTAAQVFEPNSAPQKALSSLASFLWKNLHSFEFTFGPDAVKDVLTDWGFHSVSITPSLLGASGFGIGVLENLFSFFSKSGRGPIMGTINTLKNYFIKPKTAQATVETLQSLSRAA